MIPTNLKYTTDHIWINPDTGEVGITEHFLPNIDMCYIGIRVPFTKGEKFGFVMSGYTQKDLFMPVSGEIIETNGGAESDPDLLNTVPYQTWLIKVELSNVQELESLMSAEQYQEFLNN